MQDKLSVINAGKCYLCLIVFYWLHTGLCVRWNARVLIDSVLVDITYYSTRLL